MIHKISVVPRQDTELPPKVLSEHMGKDPVVFNWGRFHLGNGWGRWRMSQVGGVIGNGYQPHNCRTAPTKKNYLAQTVTSAQVENPDPTQHLLNPSPTQLP